MKKFFLQLRLVLIAFSSFVVFTNTAYASDDSYVNKSDSLLFESYLDSIEKYIYRDSREVISYKILCEQMISEEKELSNSNLMGFVIQEIYYQYTQDSILEVIRLIESNKRLLALEDVSNSLKSSFQYLDAFTASVLGDYDSAQESLFQLLENAIEQKDTSSIYKVMGEIGVIYGTQKDFEKSELYLKRTYEFSKIASKTASSKVHILLNLVDLYVKKEDLTEARYYNQIGLHLSDSLNMLDFKMDFLLNDIEILIKENKVQLAEETYEKSKAHAKLMDNEYYIKRCKEEFPKILIAKKNYAQALVKYEQLIKEEESGQNILPLLLGYYESAHKVAQENKSPMKAYQYLLKYNRIKDSLSLEEQKQRSEYWNIKFDVDQREKENTILTSQVLQEKTQNQLLYAIASIFFLFAIFLFGIVRQKRKYTEQLQKDVKDRTIELEKSNSLLSESNEELNQLTNILSHDLKEPIRSIVGFSSLAQKEISGNPKVQDYLTFVNQGGKQLYQLIEDVMVFQNIVHGKRIKPKQVNLNEVLRDVKSTLSNLMSEKDATINSGSLPIIYSDPSLLILAFKILIENGLKYNQSSAPFININYFRNENQHCFSFEDNGIGIAPEYQNQIFKMFRRLNSRQKDTGSGLGLSILERVLTKTNGDIRLISSKVNEGSIFQISLPEHTE